MKQSHKKGFTLVEILVVIVIITILSAIILPSLFNTQERAAQGVLTRNVNGLYNILLYHEATVGLPTIDSGSSSQNRKEIRDIITDSFDVIKNPYKKSTEIISTSQAGSVKSAAIVITQGNQLMSTAINNKNTNLWPLTAAESSKEKFIGSLVIRICKDGYLLYSYSPYNQVDNIVKIPYMNSN